MEKRKSSSNTTALRDLMKDRDDLATPEESNINFLSSPTPASLGSIAAPLETNVMALIGLSGAEVRWNWNFWIVKLRNGRRAYVAAQATFADWYFVIMGKEYSDPDNPP